MLNTHKGLYSPGTSVILLFSKQLVFIKNNMMAFVERNCCFFMKFCIMDFPAQIFDLHIIWVIIPECLA